MANFTAGTSFSDGVTNDVTALKLNALVADAVPTSNLSLNSTTGTIANFTASTANITLGTIPTLTAGTTTGTAGVFTSGTITTGLIPTLTAGTTTGTAGVFTSGTITTLNSTTPTFLGAITASTNTINVGSGQIFKDATGNVGISETVPTSKFEVRSGTGSNAGARATYEGAIKINESGLTALQSTGGLEFKGSVFGSGYGSKILGADDGQLLIGNRSNSASWSESMRIDGSGNVGIGTASPLAKLEVKSAVAKATTAVTNTINLSSSDASNALTLELALGTNSTAASRYSSIQSVESGVAYRDLLLNKDGGNVSIGTTTALSKLHVHGDLTMSNATTSSTGAPGGVAKAATYAGFLTVSINGTSRKIPYYA